MAHWCRHDDADPSKRLAKDGVQELAYRRYTIKYCSLIRCGCYRYVTRLDHRLYRLRRQRSVLKYYAVFPLAFTKKQCRATVFPLARSCVHALEFSRHKEPVEKGWTRRCHVVPAALQRRERWLAPMPEPMVIKHQSVVEITDSNEVATSLAMGSTDCTHQGESVLGFRIQRRCFVC